MTSTSSLGCLSQPQPDYFTDALGRVW
jgi:hypothetical protein